MKRRTVLSLEQALSLPYATLRFAQLGWRVVRIEPTPSGDGLPGDPNRYIGSRLTGMDDDDRRSYFVAPNVGKEAIALDLKRPEGQAVLRRLISALDADVFCCNTLPRRYAQLGIDHETLSRERPGLIWAGISAQGPDVPDAPGYDPAIQAMAAYMEVTGDPNGPPTLCGLPIIDLKAGDEVYAGVMRALFLMMVGIAVLVVVERLKGINPLVVYAPKGGTGGPIDAIAAMQSISRDRDGQFRAQGTFEHPITLAEYASIVSCFAAASISS